MLMEESKKILLEINVDGITSHIDYTYQDLMVVFRNKLILLLKILLLMNYPTVMRHDYLILMNQDNTRHPRFIKC